MRYTRWPVSLVRPWMNWLNWCETTCSIRRPGHMLYPSTRRCWLRSNSMDPAASSGWWGGAAGFHSRPSVSQLTQWQSHWWNGRQSSSNFRLISGPWSPTSWRSTQWPTSLTFWGPSMALTSPSRHRHAVKTRTWIGRACTPSTSRLCVTWTWCSWTSVSSGLAARTTPSSGETAASTACSSRATCRMDGSLVSATNLILILCSVFLVDDD